jgi:hypothetical protein
MQISYSMTDSRIPGDFGKLPGPAWHCGASEYGKITHDMRHFTTMEVATYFVRVFLSDSIMRMVDP